MGRSSGFTLLEAVTTVSVLALLLAIGLPSFAALLENLRTSAAVANLISQMSHARLAAVKHGRPIILCPTTDGQRCASGGDWSTGWMMFVEQGNSQGPKHTGDLLLLELRPVTRSLLVRSSNGRNHLRYTPDGRSAGSNLTIQVCTKDRTRLAAVVVNNAGRARTERGPGEAPCPP